MTTVLEQTSVEADTADGVHYASWPARAPAIAIDLVPGVAVIATMAVVALTAEPRSWTWWVFTAAAALTFAATVVNRCVLPRLTGWSVGRAAVGIRVVRTDARRPGPIRLLARDVAHLLDTAALFVGWLWPLWDHRSRTFADLLLRTEVHTVAPAEVDSRRNRRRAASVLVAAAVLCSTGSGLAYLTTYRHDRAVQETRAQIAEQGPRMVEQVLSFGADSIVDDFARAQSLATDDYRPQLIAQQQAVQKSKAAGNEYWAVSSAVLSADVDRAAMLLALQGQRGGTAENLKFITATVRVGFEKTGDGWRIASLTVLKKPVLNGASQGQGR